MRYDPLIKVQLEEALAAEDAVVIRLKSVDVPLLATAEERRTDGRAVMLYQVQRVRGFDTNVTEVNSRRASKGALWGKLDGISHVGL